MGLRNKLYSIALAVILMFGIATVASANQVISVDASAIANDGTFLVRYEPHLGRIVIGAGVVNDTEDNTKITGFKGLFGVRKYINKQLKYKPPYWFNGFFVEGDASVCMAHLKYYGEEKDETVLSLTGLFGYKWVSNTITGFTAEIGIGPRYNSAEAFHGYDPPKTEAIVALNLGYSWLSKGQRVRK